MLKLIPSCLGLRPNSQVEGRYAPTPEQGFLGRNKVTILTGLGVGTVAILAFSILAFPPVAAAFGIAGLIAKISLASMPLVIKIMGLIALIVVFTVPTICIVADKEEDLKKEVASEAAEYEAVEDGAIVLPPSIQDEDSRNADSCPPMSEAEKQALRKYQQDLWNRAFMFR